VTIWITKYALTQGIYKVKGETEVSDKVLKVRQDNGYTIMFYEDDWHLSSRAAVSKAEEMKTKKLTSLKKQLAKLEKLSFVEEP